MQTRPIGSTIGATAGLVFALVNANAVPAPILWRIAAAAAFAAAIWFVILRGPKLEQVPPSRQALRTYGVSVAAMVVAIPVGAQILSHTLNKPNTVLVWVVLVVGAYFLPFTRAFHPPLVRWLSASLIAVAIIGAVPTLASNSATAAGWTGVAAGFNLLFFSAAGPHLIRPKTSQSA